MCKSPFRISTSASALICLAHTSPGPSASIYTTFGPSLYNFAHKSLMLRTISVTSSLTPGIVENSCNTPSILIDDTATPGNDDSKILLKELPNVIP